MSRSASALVPKVDLPGARIGNHLGAGAFDDHLAEMQQRNALGEIQRDVTIVMIEHNMDVALDFAERITLLHFGKVVVEGTRTEVVNDPHTREVYLGQ